MSRTAELWQKLRDHFVRDAVDRAKSTRDRLNRLRDVVRDLAASGRVKVVDTGGDKPTPVIMYAVLLHVVCAVFWVVTAFVLETQHSERLLF